MSENPFMSKAKGTIPIQQRISKRHDEAEAIDDWRQFGIFDGLQLAQAGGSKCSYAYELHETAQNLWRTSGFSEIEFYSSTGGQKLRFNDEAKSKAVPIPRILLAQLKGYIKEELPDFPWYSGAIKGFLKGVTGRVYEVHKVAEKDGVLNLILYDAELKAKPAESETTTTLEAHMQQEAVEVAPKPAPKTALETYLDAQKLKLRQFNVINVDEQQQRLYQTLASLAKMPEAEVTCITEAHPKVLREKIPTPARLICLMQQDRVQDLPEFCYAINPNRIEFELVKNVGDYLAEARGLNRTPVLGITHIDKLLDTNQEKKVKEYLTKMSYKLADFDGIGLLGLSYKAMDEKAAASIARTAEGL